MKFNDFIKKNNLKRKESDKIKEFELYADTANLITEVRLHLGLTQAQLAKKVGTRQSGISRVENGSSLPSLSFLLRIAKATGTYLIAPKFGFMLELNNISTQNITKSSDSGNNNYSNKTLTLSGYFQTVSEISTTQNK